MPPRLAPFAIAAGVFAVDRVTKAVIEQTMTLWDARVVIPGFFQIIRTENRGAAFSMLADASETVRMVVLIGLSVAILAMIARFLWTSSGRAEPWSLRLGLALVLGGALGNVYDRLLRGAVTDFLDVYIGNAHWPTFNVADSAISVGAALMLLSMWGAKRRREAAHTT